ncbi:MAG TPA: choice-of-anchor P family protein [Candidatus Angelobacter sp.]|nr:choice-of-anchor P family protein [Candidatus Angelobacter sp.]
MSKPSPRYSSQYIYHASAFGLAAEIERPVRQSVHTQAPSVLSCSGGRGSNRADKFSLPPFIAFDAAYTEVGGSYDHEHNKHTTYATAVVEGLNIADVVTADRVVARTVVYSPEVGDHGGEHSYDITGSHFNNLRIAGHHVDVKLATHVFHEHDTYSKFQTACHKGTTEKLLPWGDQNDKRLDELEKLEEQYHALAGLGKRAKQWKERKNTKDHSSAYWCSAAGHLDLVDHVKETELKNFGSIIVVPKFGVIRLAEMIVSKEHRSLTMFRVEMCSAAGGGGSGGGTSGSGGGSAPPGS